ncbi:cytochrome P450 3A21-like [Branchiostoma floridae]|uniref:Cytochrome P450 3A21-like n=1 Tax=Branchiostoma floridae TaxID=7739 RepID=A0A9J7LQP0_BRAFL|nr:cytochrome P450 3A21-like [Branchiostoma floridae]
MVGDLEIIKEITVKEINKFTNRRPLPGQGEIFDNSLLGLKDADWKRVRSAITPTFSSGKLKQMAAQIEHCAERLVASLAENQKKGTEFDMKQ